MTDSLQGKQSADAIWIWVRYHVFLDGIGIRVFFWGGGG